MTSIEIITAYATAIALAIGVVVTAVVKAVGAIAALKGQLETIGHALGLGDSETIRQSIDALRTDVNARLDVVDKRVGTLEVKFARLDCDPDEISGPVDAPPIQTLL